MRVSAFSRLPSSTPKIFATCWPATRFLSLYRFIGTQVPGNNLGPSIIHRRVFSILDSNIRNSPRRYGILCTDFLHLGRWLPIFDQLLGGFKSRRGLHQTKNCRDGKIFTNLIFHEGVEFVELVEQSERLEELEEQLLELEQYHYCLPREQQQYFRQQQVEQQHS
jgi:hypothetical protein